MFNEAGALVLYFPLSNNGSIVGINNINKEINKTIVVYKKKNNYIIYVWRMRADKLI
jgi:hypothetical protein